ncbi:MAG: UDP-N-acetylglucosamine 1-carboxyvinyltransferase [Candidatus Fonsibacter ubiquis]|jgi:UDP-N-acetylglucosamine 1-carboxyvinyltransferase|nr:UDP-N-acetylglucosamine 1-carboxyvinyltransferase [Candidatus Fonsibacter ubiquis]NDB38656.1 UDP-N-acetylglucosamine 1-carboxyvinyltransferase [Pseudomonadota bacterium]GBL34396.1 UDP-N-acetylglucosamine 1-carboxyvinyltransferase [Pelagibacterales bacterium]NCU51607.1 UDP-N-acetylglucosamine 1-carboxyvinyltransferase [Candidatus Fonsibacter ubiquis]NCU52370.1 UDP-N-acetylglucosamine 1-carboxyvinyltransferase [Candidatus Fonsibacter ubiquis]
MQKLLIKGGKKLSGEVVISGSKNASLPIIISSLLFDDSVHFENVPKVRDIFTLINLIKVLGREVEFNEEKEILKISNKNKNKYFAPYSIMRTMRAGVLVLAPLLAKFGKARVSLPGGCSIGARPVNLHLEALKKLGAKINVKNGYIDAIAPKGLSGSNIKFPSISVGATESIIIAAVLAKGITKISNAAIEPEIIDLINFLNKCGADIKYNSKRKIIIKGVKFLYPVRHRIIPDRIEAATYAIAALITNGKLLVKKVNNEHLENIFNVLKKIGANIKIFKDSFVIFRKHQLKPFKIITKPYPGFPTDMQAQFMALATQIKGSSVINEEIFENRFLHVSELMRMGADIKIKKQKAVINGIKNLNSAEVMATDLRASVSLVLAALSAKGTTTINRIYHLDRGYSKLEKKLNLCGANIKRVND